MAVDILGPQERERLSTIPLEISDAELVQFFTLQQADFALLNDPKVWVRPANTTQDGPARLVTLSSNSKRRNFTLGQGLWGNRPSDVWDVRLRTTATSKNGMPSVTTPAGTLATELSHIVYTRGADGVVRIYVDGVQVISETIGGDFSNWSTSYRLGLANELTRNRPWLGELYLVAIYNRALTPDEVGQNYDAGPGTE